MNKRECGLLKGKMQKDGGVIHHSTVIKAVIGKRERERTSVERGAQNGSHKEKKERKVYIYKEKRSKSYALPLSFFLSFSFYPPPLFFSLPFYISPSRPP